MKTKYLKEQICEILKNKILFCLFFLMLISCKKEVLKNETKNKERKISNITCAIKKSITDIDSLNNNLILFFKLKKTNKFCYDINVKGILSYGFGNYLVCNQIELEHLCSSVNYTPNSFNAIKSIFEFHFTKGTCHKSFENIKKELVRCSNKINLSHDEEDKFFGFMKTGLVFLLDKNNNEIIIIEYNLFSNPNNHDEMIKFIELNKKNFDGILISDGYPKIKIIK